MRQHSTMGIAHTLHKSVLLMNSLVLSILPLDNTLSKIIKNCIKLRTAFLSTGLYRTVKPFSLRCHIDSALCDLFPHFEPETIILPIQYIVLIFKWSPFLLLLLDCTWYLVIFIKSFFFTMTSIIKQVFYIRVFFFLTIHWRFLILFPSQHHPTFALPTHML